MDDYQLGRLNIVWGQLFGGQKSDIFIQDDLDILKDYKVAILADDSGSMKRGYNELLLEGDNNSLEDSSPGRAKTVRRLKDMQDGLMKILRQQDERMAAEFAELKGDVQRKKDILEENKIALSRFDEVKTACEGIIKVCGCFGKVDLFFFNRRACKGLDLVSEDDKTRFEAVFGSLPMGQTLVIDRVKQVVNEVNEANTREIPVLLFIVTDGHPDADEEEQARVGRFLVDATKLDSKHEPEADINKKHTPMPKFRVQFVMCTEAADDAKWLNEVEGESDRIDAIDDYDEELKQVRKKDPTKKFTRGDWTIKTILGPVLKYADDLDERSFLKREKEAEWGVRHKKVSAKKCTIS